MKTLSFFTLLICALFAFSASGQDIVGSGNPKSEIRKIASFESIDVGLAFQVTLTQGKSQRVSIEADDNILPYIVTEVKNKKLYIKMSGNRGFDSKCPMKIDITIPAIREIEASGASSISSESLWKSQEMELDISAASKLTLRIDVTSLKLELAGASKVDLSGSAGVLKAEVSAAAKLNAENLNVRKADIEVAGAANAEITVTEEIEYEANGASKLTFKGSPRVLKAEVSTAASVSERK